MGIQGFFSNSDEASRKLQSMSASGSAVCPKVELGVDQLPGDIQRGSGQGACVVKHVAIPANATIGQTGNRLGQLWTDHDIDVERLSVERKWTVLFIGCRSWPKAANPSKYKSPQPK